MSEAQTWIIQTEDLQVGTALSFDLTDTNGQILLKAGVPIQERLKEILRKKNINSVTVRGAANSEAEKTEATLLSSYDTERIEAIQSAIASTQDSIMKVVQAAQNGEASGVKQLGESIDQFLAEANKDISVSLALVGLRSKLVAPSIAERIAARATKLSLLAIVISLLRKDEVRESLDVGMAGALHDSSLMVHPEWFSGEKSLRDDSIANEYRRHPLESAEMLNGIEGISKNTIMIVSQVHEQADGSGYPRGLRLKQAHPGAVILNLADAYLELTFPIQGAPMDQSDSIAYLSHHAAMGKFCKSTFVLLMNGLSLYPIGSTVILDDDSMAVVIQSNIGYPLQPVVRLLHESHSTKLDLKQSKLRIARQSDGVLAYGAERIKKSQMQSVLWRTDH
jgi:HD-GYP domain-containing protein (c-di-GMP phosphodiesterase class II)